MRLIINIKKLSLQYVSSIFIRNYISSYLSKNKNYDYCINENWDWFDHSRCLIIIKNNSQYWNIKYKGSIQKNIYFICG